MHKDIDGACFRGSHEGRIGDGGGKEGPIRCRFIVSIDVQVLVVVVVGWIAGIIAVSVAAAIGVGRG